MSFPTAANIINPASKGYGVSLEKGTANEDKMFLRLADGPQRVSGIQTTNEQQLPDTSQNPEDIAAGLGQTFSRTRFSGGEGLDRGHRQSTDPAFDASRYWDSRNVDVRPAKAGAPEQVTLLKAAEKWRTSTDNNQFMTLIGSTLYWAEEKDVKRSADPTAATPTVTSEDPEGGGGTPTNISGLVVLGEELYATLNNEGIHKRSTGGTWAHWSDLDTDAGNSLTQDIWSVKGRIIAAKGIQLYEAKAGAASVLLHTLATNLTWHSVIDAGSAILAAASDGHIYSWADEAGTLTYKSLENFEGEIPYFMGMSQGVLFVGTGEATVAGGKIGRLWIGEVIGHKIRNLQVVRVWGTGTETRNRVPQAFLPTRDSMYFSVLEDGTENHLWRFDLETTGLSRDMIFDASGICQGLLTIDDRLFASFQSLHFWREHLTNYATPGWLIGPLADNFTSRPKIQVGLRVDTKLPTTEETITLKYSTDPAAIEDSDHSSWKTGILNTLNTLQEDVESEYAINNVESRYLASQLVLVSSTDYLVSPTVYSYAQRSLLATEDLTIRIYVNVSDTVKKFGYKAVRIPGHGRRLWTELHDNWLNNSIVLELFRPNIKVRGQIVNMSTPIQGHTDRGELTTFTVLDVQGIKV